MKLKLAFATATALGLVLSTAAYADDNKAFTAQSGSNNSATVTQSGGSDNQAGTIGDAMTQSGSNNVLVILQDGQNGEIGVKTGTDDYHTPPSGNIQYSLTYQGVNQTSSGVGYNSASLTQHGVGSVVGQVQQNSSGMANGNTVISEQTGGNTINHIFQTQDSATVGNSAVIVQGGSGNVIDRVDQKGSGAGANNTINVTISGNDNGVVDLTGTGPFYTSRAWAMGATQSALIQNNYGNTNGVALPGTVSGNQIYLTITGNSNQYGMTQKGSDNTTGNVLISGSNNSFGSYQAGQGNVIGAGEIAGSDNDTGIWQIGSTNSATVSVLATGSNFNELSIAQQGTTNVATANITGSFNGTGMLAGAAGSLGLSNGMIAQGANLGDGANSATLDIYGDFNKFAIASLGSGNLVTGKIGTAGVGGDSDSNSAAVLQSGDNNTASFSQAGTGSNIVAISQ